jgi:hypothetical protein
MGACISKPFENHERNWETWNQSERVVPVFLVPNVEKGRIEAVFIQPGDAFSYTIHILWNNEYYPYSGVCYNTWRLFRWGRVKDLDSYTVTYEDATHLHIKSVAFHHSYAGGQTYSQHYYRDITRTLPGSRFEVDECDGQIRMYVATKNHLLCPENNNCSLIHNVITPTAFLVKEGQDVDGFFTDEHCKIGCFGAIENWIIEHCWPKKRLLHPEKKNDDDREDLVVPTHTEEEK